MQTLPPEILYLILSSTSSLPDLLSLSHTTRSLRLVYLDRRPTLLPLITKRHFHPTILDLLDHLRPCSSHREEASFHFWQQWTFRNVLTDRLAQKIPLDTQPTFSPTPGTVGPAELEWLRTFDQRLESLIDSFVRRAEGGLGATNDDHAGWACPSYLQSDIIHLAMMDPTAPTTCLLDIFRLGREGRARLRTGLVLMLSISKHLYSAGTIIKAMERAEIDPMGLDDGIDGVRRYWLDARFLFGLSLEDHIYLISTCFHFRKAFNPCWLGDLLYWEIEGALVYLHLLSRFDFGLGSEVLANPMMPAGGQMLRVKKRLIKGVLAYVDSYGIFNAFQSQIRRVGEYLSVFTPQCGYNRDHFLELEVEVRGERRSVLIMRKGQLPRGGSSDDYVPRLKDRLLAVDDGGEPNRYFFEEEGAGGFV